MTWARLVASGFGAGHAPRAPGTVGSLVALLLGALLLRLSPASLPLTALIVTLAGLWAVAHAAGAEDDPGWVVIDEYAGQLLAMTSLARPSAAGLAAAFAVFRLLDIAKPGPIGWADRQHGAAGVMGDDVIAGLLAAGVLWAVQARWPGMLG